MRGPPAATGRGAKAEWLLVDRPAADFLDEIERGRAGALDADAFSGLKAFHYLTPATAFSARVFRAGPALPDPMRMV